MSRKFSLRRKVAAALIALAATFSVGAAAVDSSPAPDAAQEEAAQFSISKSSGSQTQSGGTWSRWGGTWS